MKSSHFDYDLTSGYYKKNPYITQFQTQASWFLDHYMNALEKVIVYFDEKPYMKGTFTPMLDSIRSSLLGRANYPHQHFMAVGTHAITLVSSSRP